MEKKLQDNIAKSNSELIILEKEGNGKIKKLGNQPFNKLSVNLTGYLLQFFEQNEIFNFCKINRKLKKALNSELIWENFVLKDELFIPDDRNDFISWKNYYLSINKLKVNMKGGKPNIGFKMKPMRGHPNYITAMTCYEDNINNAMVISGDHDGNVFYWVINEDEDYEHIKIIKLDFEIINLKTIKIEEISRRERIDSNTFDSSDKAILVITTRSFFVYGK
jgi:hypothetical protein